jgi:hypothetical protein
MSQQIELEDQLRISICKIKCVSFFIETQDPDYSKPTDFDEIQQGLVSILNEIVTDLVDIKDKLEN